MSGQMRKFNYAEYYKQLEVMPEPIMASELPKVKLNLRGMRQEHMPFYTADRQDLQWRLRESAWLAVCSRVALQI